MNRPNHPSPPPEAVVEALLAAQSLLERFAQATASAASRTADPTLTDFFRVLSVQRLAERDNLRLLTDRELDPSSVDHERSPALDRLQEAALDPSPRDLALLCLDAETDLDERLRRAAAACRDRAEEYVLERIRRRSREEVVPQLETLSRG